MAVDNACGQQWEHLVPRGTMQQRAQLLGKPLRCVQKCVQPVITCWPHSYNGGSAQETRVWGESGEGGEGGKALSVQLCLPGKDTPTHGSSTAFKKNDFSKKTLPGREL